MGKFHRERRRVTKVVALRLGYRETELGEIKEHVSKAEARRRFINEKGRQHWRGKFEEWAINTLMERAREEIVAIEDARVFGTISAAIAELQHDPAPY